MRISDWSSDVCSSDLRNSTCAPPRTEQAAGDGGNGVGVVPDAHRRVQRVLEVQARESMCSRIQFGNRRRVNGGDCGLQRGHGEPVGREPTSRARDRLVDPVLPLLATLGRSEEHTSELQSLMRISYAVFCLKKKTNKQEYNQVN